MRYIILTILTFTILQSCRINAHLGQQIKPKYITEKVGYDTDDPAIWFNAQSPEKSLIIGTDKDSDGALFAFDLQGKIVKKSIPLQRPNNVDIIKGFDFNGEKIDIAVTTERERNSLRVFKLPELEPIDNGGIPVFENETQRAPMGVALFQSSENQAYAVVGRKEGPLDNYLFQYELNAVNGYVIGKLVRKFGKFSGKKEIEAIAVDSELGFVYYSDEGFGVRKYYADPNKGNEEIAVFGTKDFKDDVEGISIYKKDGKTGYIIVSNQQVNSMNVYPREGSINDPHQHVRIAEFPLTTKESDGNESSSHNFGAEFPLGIFVAMSNGKTFHIFDWRDIQAWISKENK